MKPRKRMLEAVAVLLLAVALLGCTQQPVQPKQKHDFSADLKLAETAYSSAGLSGQDIQAINSGKLFTQAERNALTEKLSAAEQKLNSVLDSAKSLPQSGEKKELLGLLSLEFSKLSYYKSMVQLKDRDLFKELAMGIDLIDLNSLQTGKCTGLGRTGELEKQYSLAEYSAEGFKRQLSQFTASFPSAAQQFDVNSKKPVLAGTSIGEFVKTAVFLSGACDAFSEAIDSLKGLETASAQDSPCFSLAEIKKYTSSLSGAAEKLDSMSKKAPSIGFPSAISSKLSEKAKELLSTSTEMNDLYSQLEKECR